MSQVGLESLLDKLKIPAASIAALMDLHRKRLQQADAKRPDSLKSYQQLHTEIESMGENSSGFTVENGAISINTQVYQQQLPVLLEQLRPWKKGPFLFNQETPIKVDAEWRCDLKWNRIASHTHLFKGRSVLDVGANNGYYAMRTLASGAAAVLAIDPILHVYTQGQLIKKLSGVENLEFGLWGVQDMPHFGNVFDVILYMGIIYHHRDPVGQLEVVRQCLKSDGHLFLETIGIPGIDSSALFPPGRYAQMPNVWFIPTKECLINWCLKAKFKKVEVLEDSELTIDEQRVTRWSGPVSLQDFLDPNDSGKTIEGYPAPRRFLLLAKK
jgi:tRNA (mo5U34)-methyltransferase